ncbi:hypothetical protein IJ707_03500 [bacterium]|nr:hypothetical protein [bacterium]
MSDIKYTDNEIKFGFKKICFDLKIRTVVYVEKIVVILLEVPYSDNKTLNNIHAFNILGDKIWTVQSVKEKYPDLETYLPFENLFYSDNVLKASDFMGRLFFINSKDGKLLNMEIFK